jgi:hypothetical protein
VLEVVTELKHPHQNLSACCFFLSFFLSFFTKWFQKVVSTDKVPSEIPKCCGNGE